MRGVSDVIRSIFVDDISKVSMYNADNGMIKCIGKTPFCPDKLIGVELEKLSPNEVDDS